MARVIFTVEGTVRGRPASITFDAGELDGDAEAIARVEEMIGLADVLDVTPTGPTIVAGLSPPQTALLTIAAAFDGDTTTSGEVPAIELEEIPPRRDPLTAA
jgi:hypothetical protein